VLNRIWRLMPTAASLLCLAGAARAEDPTTELLTRTRVREAVAIEGPLESPALCLDPTPDHKSGKTEGRRGCIPVPPKTVHTFVASTRDPLSLLWLDFNPFKVDVALATSTELDANAKALDDLFDLLAALPKALEPVKTGQHTLAAFRETPEAAMSDPLLDAFETYLQALVAAPVDGDDFDQWGDQATGPAGLDRVLGELDTGITDLSRNLETIEAARKAVADLARLSTLPRNDKALATLFQIVTTDDGVVRLKQQLVAALKALKRDLAAVRASKWSGNARVLADFSASIDEVVVQTVTARAMDIDVKNGVLTKTIGAPVAITVRLRGHRRFVPEKATGLIHTRLQKAVYKAVGEAGSRVVEKGENEPVDVGAAATYNFVCRCLGDSPVHPVLQLGVSTGADIPLFLVGGGLRLGGKRALSISAGGVAAWLKDLDELSIGSPVASDLDIQADLKRKFTMKAYFGLQYKF
jgi:hypothetical protein